MLDRIRSITNHRYGLALAWVAIVTAGMGWFIAFPYVPPQGVTVREDTTNFTMFEMSGENYTAILRAVDSGQLVRTEMRDGFELFTRGTLSKRQLAGRIRVGGEVIDQYIDEHRAAARPMLLGVWAVLALLLPTIALAGTMLWRKPQPLTAPPVKPEMM